MKTATKTASKTTAKGSSKTAKTASKTATTVSANVESKPATLTFSAILAAALADKFGKVVAGYFKTAATHAKRVGTVFPRAPYADDRATWEALAVDKREARIAEIFARISAGYGRAVAGTNEARALYDLMRTK